MIEHWSAGPPDGEMSEAMLVGLAGEIERHPWWIARARLTMELLAREALCPPATVLDAGCGWGVTLDALERRGYRAEGLDVSAAALRRLDQPGRRLIMADLTQPLPAGHREFDAVLALDVIEHLDDDRAAVARLASLARPGGLIVLTVPALEELYSEFDEVQGHRRRYDERDLRRACEGTGLHVRSIAWWGRSFVPLLRWQRRSRSTGGEAPADIYGRYVRAPRPPLSWVLGALAQAEVAWTLSGRATIGTSLIAIARRAV